MRLSARNGDVIVVESPGSPTIVIREPSAIDRSLSKDH